jgi:dienelactone hydrolase
MATPTLTKTTLPGAVGEILIDVRAADRAAPGPAVLVLHGFKGFKDWGMFPPFAERLARSGFTAIGFNVSGSGVNDAGEFALPERFGHNTFSAELADVAMVLEALEAGGLGVPRPSSIGIVGHSRGGGMAILAARRHPGLTALVTWAAISTVERWTEDQRLEWRARGRLDVVNARTGQVLPMYVTLLDDIDAHAGSSLDIAAAAGALTIPWLLVHGEADESVPVAEADRLARAAGRPIEVLKIARGGHTFGAVHPFAGPTPELERVFDASVRFLGAHLS